MKRKPEVRRFRDRDGTIYLITGTTRRREHHPRHERKALGISSRQQRKLRRARRGR